MKRLVIILIPLLFSFPSGAQNLTIDSCYSIAQRNYPLIRQYELIEKSKEYTISNANKAWLPQFSVTGIGAYVFGGFPQIGPPGSQNESSDFKFIGLGQLNQVIWDGGATKAQKNIIEAQSSIDKANADVQMFDLKDRINQLYFGILLIDEQVKQIDLQTEMLNRNVKRLELMHSNGYALKTEINELRAEVLKIKQRRTDFEFSRKEYIQMLSLFLGTAVGDSVHLLKPVETLNAEIKNNRPELLLFQNQLNMIDAQGKLTNVRIMPKIGLLGAGVLITPGINFGSEEMSSLALAGLSLKWDIGGLYTRSSSKNLTTINSDKIRLQQEIFQFNNNIQQKQRTIEIEKYKTIVQSDDEIVDLRKNIRESYQLQYDNGTSSLLELINATDKETEARSNKAYHDVQLMLAVYQLKTITGN
jgi:outer membrane protein TolC